MLFAGPRIGLFRRIAGFGSSKLVREPGHRNRPLTTRFYYTDAYRVEFTANVVDKSAMGCAYLDETAFIRPPAASRTISDARRGVVDVVDEDDRIAHVLSSPLSGDGQIKGTVNWTRRFDHMQQHTGQHLLSAVFEDLFGYKTVSVHFGPDYSTLDLDTELLTHQQIVKAEQRANAFVGEARPVTVAFEDAQSAAGLRKASDREGTLRIVSIDAVDRSACGGTHVRTTAEIGAVLLRSSEKIRKASAWSSCAARGPSRGAPRLRVAQRIATSLSSSIDDAASLVGAGRPSEGGERRTESVRTRCAHARERYDATTPNATGVRTIVIRDAATMDDAKAVAQAAFALPKVVVIGRVASPPSVLVAASEDSGVDAGKSLGTAAAVGGRGGGT